MERGQIRRRKGFKQDRTGCLTCRYRRKRCTQNTFPTCGTCARLNLECVRDPIRQVVPEPHHDSPGQERFENQPQLPPAVFCSQFSPPSLDMSSPRRRQAMNYYIRVLSGLLTISQSSNSFLCHFLPLAMESPAVAEALIAYSSGHMSYLDASYVTVSLEARSKALRELSMVVGVPAHNTSLIETAASTCLILLTSEVCLGSHQSWYNHLVGTKHLISRAWSRCSVSGLLVQGTEVLSLTPEGRWILRNFAYHDIIGSITLGTQPLLDPEYLRGITYELDSYLGVASGLLILIAETAQLSFNSVGDESRPRSSQNCLSMEHSIKNWQCPNGTPSNLEAVAYAYRGAALIYLYRKMRQHPPAHNDSWLPCWISEDTWEDNIQEAVASTLSYIVLISEGDISESCLLFPLFIAGGEAICQEQIEMIRARLKSLYMKRKFRNISRALEVLEELWANRQQTSGGSGLNWEDILRSSEEPLLLT